MQTESLRGRSKAVAGFDASAFAYLARNYRLWGESAWTLCRHNASVRLCVLFACAVLCRLIYTASFICVFTLSFVYSLTHHINNNRLQAMWVRCTLPNRGRRWRCCWTPTMTAAACWRHYREIAQAHMTREVRSISVCKTKYKDVCWLRCCVCCGVVFVKTCTFFRCIYMLSVHPVYSCFVVVVLRVSQNRMCRVCHSKAVHTPT